MIPKQINSVHRRFDGRFGGLVWNEENGKRPVAFASRYLNEAKKNYAVNELEPLAVKWATENFKHYLMGRQIIVEIDHKALVSVFNRHRMRKECNGRFTRWQIRLLPSDFEVKNVAGSRMGIAEYLIRNPIFKTPPAEDASELVVPLIRRPNQQKKIMYLRTAIQIMNLAAQ